MDKFKIKVVSPSRNTATKNHLVVKFPTKYIKSTHHNPLRVQVHLTPLTEHTLERTENHRVDTQRQL